MDLKHLSANISVPTIHLESLLKTINSADTGPDLNLVSVRSSHVVLMLRETAAPTHHRALLPVRPWKPGGLTADPARVYFSLPFT